MPGCIPVEKPHHGRCSRFLGLNVYRLTTVCRRARRQPSSSIDSIGRARHRSCCTGVHRLAKGSTGSAVRTDPDDVLARCFGGDECAIGVIDELIAGRSLGQHSHADAHRHRSRIILEAPLDSGTNAFGDLLCDDNRCTGHDDDKLFSAEAGTDIENPHAGMKDVGDLS